MSSEPAVASPLPTLQKNTPSRRSSRRLWWRPRIGARRYSDFLLRLVAMCIVLGGWQLASGSVSRVVLPSPLGCLRAADNLVTSGELSSAWVASLGNIGVAVGASTIVGLVLGIMLGRYSAVDSLTAPVFASVFLTPKIALLPIITLWLGYETNAKILFIFGFTLFEMLYTIRKGVKEVGRDYIEFGRSICLSEAAMIRKVILPSIWPYTLVGLRLSILHGLVGAVLAGFFLENSGIGGLVYESGSTFHTANLFVVIFSIMIVGLAISYGLSKLERQLVPWQRLGA